MHKIFESFRNNGNFNQHENFFKFTAFEPASTSSFCYKNIDGKPPSCIIDGNTSTAYAENSDNSFQHEQQITVQFLYSPVYVHTLYYTALCGPPKDFLVEGSNDNKTWVTLAKQDSPLKEYSINAIKCHVKKTFSFIKMSQSKTIDDKYRNAYSRT